MPILDSIISECMVARSKKKIKIVSVGRGNGEEVLLLREKGYSVVGVDPDLREDLKVKEFFFEAKGNKLPFNKESFDIILFLEVIEHIGIKQGTITEVDREYIGKRKETI